MTQSEAEKLRENVLMHSTWYRDLGAKKNELAGYIKELSYKMLSPEEAKYLAGTTESFIIQQRTLNPVALMEALDPENTALHDLEGIREVTVYDFAGLLSMSGLNFPEIFWDPFKRYDWKYRPQRGEGAEEAAEKVVKDIPEQDKKKLVKLLEELFILAIGYVTLLQDLKIAIPDDIKLGELKEKFPEAYKILKNEK
jgi:hypothetical protein